MSLSATIFGGNRSVSILGGNGTPTISGPLTNAGPVGASGISFTSPIGATGNSYPTMGGGSFNNTTHAYGGAHIYGDNPVISMDNGSMINLKELAGLLEVMKLLSDEQMSLPFPDRAKLEKYEVLRVQWQDVMELAKQYKITEALISNEHENQS